MRGFLKIILIFFSTISLASYASDQTPQSLDELKVAIEKIRVETKTPAVGLVLINAHGPELVEGFGDSSNGKADQFTRFRIGSISKMIVALAILRLIDEGKLSLDDRLTSLAPEIKFDNPWETENPIRLVHLLEHTTGWDNTHPKELTYIVTEDTPLLNILSFHSHSRTSRWQPGTRMAYNNTGPVVAAYIVEKVTGQSFTDYVNKTIFATLSMNATEYFPKDVTQNLALPHFQGMQQDFIYDATWPSGALMSSPHDMAILLSVFLNKNERDLLDIDKSLIDRMENPGSTLGARLGMKTGYGLGNYTDTYDKSMFLFHGHRGTIKGSLAELFYSHELQYGYAIMMNDMNLAYFQISDLIRRYILSQRSKTVAVENRINTRIVSSIEIDSDLKGLYLPESSSSAYARFGEHLFGSLKFVVDGKLLVVSKLFGEKVGTYQTEDGSLFLDEETGLSALALVDDPVSGKMIELNGYTGNTSYKKVSWVRGYGLVSLIAVVLVSGIMTVLCIIFVAIRKLIKPSLDLQLSIFFFPFLALIFLFGYYYLSNLIAYNQKAFGEPSAVSLSLLGVSILWVMALLYSLYRHFWLGLSSTHRYSRYVAGSLLLSQTLLCLIMMAYGLIGIPTWL